MSKPIMIRHIGAAVEQLKIVQNKKYPGNEVLIPIMGMGTIEYELGLLGYEHDFGDGDNTNGWEVDFWYRFKKKGEKTIVVSGSLWQTCNTYTLCFDYEEDTTKKEDSPEEGSEQEVLPKD